MRDLGAVLTDIEGTTTPISFVHDVLFPYARRILPAMVGSNDPEISSALERVRQAAPGHPPLETLHDWMDRDVKAEPLKTLQGIVWRTGYASGEIQAVLYPDVAPALARWRRAGLRLAVYSSGSVEAQRLIFGHAPSGDLTGLFDAFFDTRVGPKRAQASYAAIAADLALPPGRILFLSDVAAELDAAAAAGLTTCQLLRPGDEAVPSAHPRAADFDAVELLFA